MPDLCQAYGIRRMKTGPALPDRMQRNGGGDVQEARGGCCRSRCGGRGGAVLGSVGAARRWRLAWRWRRLERWWLARRRRRLAWRRRLERRWVAWRWLARGVGGAALRMGLRTGPRVLRAGMGMGRLAVGLRRPRGRDGRCNRRAILLPSRLLL